MRKAKAPRFIQIETTTLPDPAGHIELVILGLTGAGEVWIKRGGWAWRRVSGDAFYAESTQRKPNTTAKGA